MVRKPSSGQQSTSRGAWSDARLAQTGDLQRTADQVRRRVPVVLERERQLAAAGRGAAARATSHRQRREQRARALGFADLEAFYRAR
jgi:hypothetical protein